MVDINEYMEQFLEDLDENLENLDTGILELEKDKKNLDVINNIFRAMHTIKGSFGAMGLVNLERLTHRLEDLLSKARNQELDINEKIIDILYVCHDIISSSITTITETGSDEELNFDTTIDRIKILLNESMETDEERQISADINDLSDKEKKSIKSAVKKDNGVYRFHIIMDKKDDFALVRAFMVYKEIRDVFDIVKSTPEEETLVNATGAAQDLKIIVTSKSIDEVVIDKIKKIPAVNDIIIEKLTAKKLDEELGIQLPKNFTSEALDDSINDQKMAEDLKKYISINLSKVEEVLNDIEKFEGKIDDNNLYQLYRHFHSVRGLAGLLEENHILKLISQIEKTLDRLRNLDVLEKVYINLLKFAPKMIENSYNDILEDDKLIDEFVNKLEDMSKDLEEKSKQNREKIVIEKDAEDQEAEDIINELLSDNSMEEVKKTRDTDTFQEFTKDFEEETSTNLEEMEMLILRLESDSNNMDIVDSIYRNLHSIKGLSGFLEKRTIEKIAHLSEDILNKIKRKELYVNRIFIDKILETIDFIKKLAENENLENDEKFMKRVETHIEELTIIRDAKGEKIGEILKKELGLSDEDVEALVEKQKKEYKNMKLGEIAVREKKAQARDVVEALRKQDAPIETAKTQPKTYIRVDVEKIDSMVNMIGELMILHSQITQDEHLLTQEQRTKSLRMGKLVKTLQNDSMSLRMVSLKQTFQKVLRVARKAKQDLGKNIDIEIIGEDTEIDRNIAERILDPLSHMIKNSISHGIEPEEDRLKLNKPKYGNITLSAYSKKGNVFIEITDDGRGLDPEKIYNKALEKDVIDKNRSYTNDEIYNFIFLPGFSTEENVNKISGRGVGMDVVKTEISGAGGKVEIDTEINRGTTFILKIPINLAALNGTMIKIEDEIFVIPTIFIKEIIREDSRNRVEIAGKQKMIKVRDKLIPLIKREQYFNLNSENNSDDIIIVLETESMMKALKVKEVLGRKEVVVKPLGEELNELEFISGATILGNGSVSLILDVDYLLKGRR